LLLIAFGQSVSRAGAQRPQRDNRPRTASIGGRVTVGGAPAANVLVTVAEADPRSQGALFGVESPQGVSIEVRTGSDGRYRITGLTEGAYVIRALSKAYVLSKSPFGVDAFRTVTVDEGELRDEVDIALVRGGVITGRVIDAEGRPVIGTEVRLFSVDEKGRPKEELDSHYGHNEWMLQTDDRGVYRIYGLTAGRYILGAGGEWASGLVRRKSSETFHPDATDRNQAKIIEVKDGAEVADIDIRLGAGEDTYAAAGRVVDAVTGQPLPRVSVLCMEAPGEGTRIGRPAATDDEGRFRCANLAPGRYELSLWERRDVSSPHYSEKIRFEVTDSDVGGLEVKAIRGATISGVVVVEGASDPAVKAKLQRMSVGVQVERLRESDADSRAYERPDRIMARIAGDGGFRLAGASPGMASFYLEGDQENAFSIRRIERDGAEIRSAFEIGRGEQITGVRIVVAHDNGTIRGQVEITGAKLPEGWQLDIWATPIKTTTANEGMPAFHTNSNGSAFADEKGRFVIERLIPGEYELSLNAMVREGQDSWTSAPGTSQVKQRVTVSSGSETMVKLTLDLERK